MIPDGWSSAKFGDVARIAEGQVDPREAPFNQMLHIGPENVSQGTGRLSDCQTCEELELISGKYAFDEKAIVYSKIRPNLNKVCYPRFSGVCSADMYPVWPDETQITPEYLYQLMLGPVFLKRAIACSMRTGMPKINRADLNGLSIEIPPLVEQRRIATRLEAWDRAIETVGALIANARAQKQALMQQLLSGKHRLPGFSGEWQRKPINVIATRVTRRNDGTELPVLTISSTSGFVRQDEKYSRYMAGKSVETYIMLNKGEFAYNKGNSKTYEFGCIFDLEGYASALVPHVYVCFKLKKGYSHRFYKALFEADYLAPQLGRLVNTGVRNNGLLNIKPSEFLGTKVPVPPLHEQNAIAAVMEAASRTVVEHETQLTALRQEKAALMQQLLTGNRRVKLPESEVV